MRCWTSGKCKHVLIIIAHQVRRPKFTRVTKAKQHLNIFWILWYWWILVEQKPLCFYCKNKQKHTKATNVKCLWNIWWHWQHWMHDNWGTETEWDYRWDCHNSRPPYFARPSNYEQVTLGELIRPSLSGPLEVTSNWFVASTWHASTYHGTTGCCLQQLVRNFHPNIMKWFANFLSRSEDANPCKYSLVNVELLDELR